MELEEGWVFCDACDSWVHQICGLFNKGRNNKDDHYNCPDCLLKGLDLGVRKRIEVRLWDRDQGFVISNGL